MKLNLPKVKFGAVANVFIKLIHFEKAGQCEYGHKHIYDHISMLSKGSVKITVNGNVTEYKAPMLVYINKDTMHEIEALEDDTVWACIHAIRNNEYGGDIVDESMIPVGVNAYEYLQQLGQNGEIQNSVACCGDLSPEQQEYLHDLQHRDFINSQESIPVGIPNNELQ